MAILGGLLSHQTKIIIDTAVAAPGWNRLTTATAGVFLAYPFVEYFTLTLCDHYLEIDVPRMRPLLRLGYFGAFLFFGLGVALGWLIDEFLVRHD